MIAVLAALALQADAPTPEQLQNLERIYAQSCADRGYGQYDDMCDSMAGQIRRVRAEVGRHPRTNPPHAPAGVQPSPAAPAGGLKDATKAAEAPALKPRG